MFEVTLTVSEESPCLPEVLVETFDDPGNWEHWPGNYWTIDWITPGAADNRHLGLCHGDMSGVTLTWCRSPHMVVTPGCYNLPIKMIMIHQLDVEVYYDRCWVEMKIGCDPWKKIYPYCGWLYNSTGWWDGSHQEDWSLFELPGLIAGDVFWIRFVTHTLDGNDNCLGDGYEGWQIFQLTIDDC